ncbi:hypothetical protein [Parathalassolituus penaei]|uniref:Uncharacterized protein n=1 Tax=Parathalassolituus penaei TaxID=2997323 RepID=A0A9X3ECJ9_9GAMM|nr:hypothetical protein [Parathalassolituus penaei]MCY0965118.1 hypothetical protein [Parathalassolituus penaei]
MPSNLKQKALATLVAGSLLTQLTACGTILYPERKGSAGGRLDIGVVALDAIGLLFWFVPGVVAFAVDFVTGAIYLPGGRHAYVDPVELERLRQNNDINADSLTRLIDARTGSKLSAVDMDWQVRAVGSDTELARLMQPYNLSAATVALAPH